MKNRLFSMTAAAIALLSSCEEMVQQEISYEVLPAEEQTVFTANLGADTKTYLEYEEGVYKTRWAEEDDIFILATNSDGSYWYEHAEIIEGVGTSTGKFAATANLKGEKYHAYYGYNSYYNGHTGKFSPQLQEYQYRPWHYDENFDWVGDNNIDGYYFPMFAESTTTSFTFQNLCAILKVDLVGTDYVENVIFTPNDSTVPVAGGTDLSFVDGEPVLTFVDSSAVHRVCFYVQEVLDPTEPASCYISIPAQKYTGGFTLTINSASGSMTVKTTEDIVFERSQIRAVPTITYKDQTTNTWGLCGVMTDWNTDIAMTLDGQYFVLEDQYLEAGQAFKFRANGDWTVNYGYNGQAIEPDTAVELTANGADMYMTETGYYDIVLDPNAGIAYFFSNTSDEPVECASYAEVAELPDNTLVKVKGYVFAPYGRGFVMNIGEYFGNCILVYQGTDLSAYTPVMGNKVSFIAKKVTYNNLPELSEIQDVEILSDNEYDYGYYSYYDLYDPEVFDTVEIDSYQYVKFAGTLEHSGSYYNVVVDGATARIGSIEYPTQDLTEFVDKKVSVEGWFIGFAGGKYLKIVLKSIALVDDSGATEDVKPGDDIIVTSRKSSRVVE